MTDVAAPIAPLPDLSASANAFSGSGPISDCATKCVSCWSMSMKAQALRLPSRCPPTGSCVPSTEMNLRVTGLSFFPGTASAGMNSPFGFMVASSDALGTSLSMSPAIVRINCTGDAISTTLSNCAP